MKAFEISEIQTATVAQLQFAQSIAKSRGKELTLVKSLIELIEGTSSGTADQIDLLRLIALFSALSLYRGYFTTTDFWRACWEGSPNQRWAARLSYCVSMWWLLRRLA